MLPSLRSALLSLACCVALPLSAQEFPVTLTDDRGVEVAIPARPERVASLGVFGADMLKALGMRAVGTTTYDGKLPAYLGTDTEGMVDLGIEPQPNIERLTRLAPDLIVGIRRYTEPWAESFAPIAPYVAFDMQTEAESFNAVTQVGTALGRADDAAALNAGYDALLQDFAAKAPGGVSALFVWLWQDTPYAYYDHVMPASVFGHLGAANAMGANPTPALPENFGGPVSYEDLLAYDPDVLIVFRAEGNAYPDHPALRRMRALREGRAWHVGYQYSQPAGPVAREIILREVAHLLYPDTFHDPGLPEGVRAEPLHIAE